ncbi:hypothetical protein F5Y16DRAFT_374100, partial [Xylariaceae sp. FL0255]
MQAGLTPSQLRIWWSLLQLACCSTHSSVTGIPTSHFSSRGQNARGGAWYKGMQFAIQPASYSCTLGATALL